MPSAGSSLVAGSFLPQQGLGISPDGIKNLQNEEDLETIPNDKEKLCPISCEFSNPRIH